MMDKGKNEVIDAFITIAKSYWNVFQYFLSQSGDIGQAITLTREMFTAIYTGQAANKESDIPSDFWDELGGLR